MPSLTEVNFHIKWPVLSVDLYPPKGRRPRLSSSLFHVDRFLTTASTLSMDGFSLDLGFFFFFWFCVFVGCVFFCFVVFVWFLAFVYPLLLFFLGMRGR